MGLGERVCITVYVHCTGTKRRASDFHKVRMKRREECGGGGGGGGEGGGEEEKEEGYSTRPYGYVPHDQAQGTDLHVLCKVRQVWSRGSRNGCIRASMCSEDSQAMRVRMRTTGAANGMSFLRRTGGSAG
ncbi:hypothetical protein LZ31DRAFT_333107 [Colletotrichum somersetense]|nr:hypothetical protein LZ31DRAFT_333107 [Colletotrichum somersetense]